MSLIELQLREEIKRLKTGWKQKEQELLTINPQAQLFLDLEVERDNLKTELANTKQTLDKQAKTNTELVKQIQQKDQELTEWAGRFKDSEKTNYQAYQALQQESRKQNQLHLNEKRKLKADLTKEQEKIKQLLTDYSLQTEQLNRELANKEELIKALNDLGTTNQEQAQQITNLQNQLQTWQEQQQAKEQQGEQVLTDIIQAISKNKTFILNDWKKRKIKQKFDQLKAIFHWEQVETDISEAET